MKLISASNISYESEPANLAVVEVTEFSFFGPTKKAKLGALMNEENLPQRGRSIE